MRSPAKLPKIRVQGLSFSGNDGKKSMDRQRLFEDDSSDFSDLPSAASCTAASNDIDREGGHHDPCSRAGIEPGIDFNDATAYINHYGARLARRYEFAGLSKERTYHYQDGKLRTLDSNDVINLELPRNRWDKWNDIANRFYESFRRIDPKNSREVRMGVGKGSRALDLGIAGARTAKFSCNGPAFAFNPSLGRQPGPLAQMREGDAAFSLVSSITTMQYAVTAFTDVVTDKAGKRAALRRAFAAHADAVACMQARKNNQTPTVAQSEAFLTFMQASRALAKFNKEASNLRRRRVIGLWRDGPISVFPALVNNARQFASILKWTDTATNALAVTSGVGSIANGACYFTEGIFTSQSIARRQKQMRRLLRQFGKALETGDMKDLSQTLRHHYRRVRRQLRWERGLAISRCVKGLVEICLGVALVTVCSLALTGASFGAVPTILGIALAVWGILYLISCGIRQTRLWAVEHRSKKRQRMAEQYIATHGTAGLATLLNGAEWGESETGDIVHTRWRQRGAVKASVKSQRFDPLTNEYLALELLSDLLMRIADADDDEGAVDRLWAQLPFVNVYQQLEAAELREILQILRSRRQQALLVWTVRGNHTPSGEAQFWRDNNAADAWFIKRMIAPALGIRLRGVGGQQESVPAIVYTKRFESVLAKKTKNFGWQDRRLAELTAAERSKTFEAVYGEMFAGGRMSVSEFLSAEERLEAGQDVALEGDRWEERRAFVTWLRERNRDTWKMG